MVQQATLQVSDKQRLKELLERVYDSHEHLVIEREGTPVAVMMSYLEYQTYRQQVAHYLLTELGKKVGAEADKQGLTEEQLIEEVRETRQELFDEKYGHLFQQG